MQSTTNARSTNQYNRHGKQAEDEAGAWWNARLLQTGGRILGRNIRFRFGEIDWVVEEGALTLVFVEVRSRRYAQTPSFRPVETLSPEKRRRIERAAAAFLGNYRGTARQIRFDLLVREEEEGAVSWTHLPGAWLTGSE